MAQLAGNITPTNCSLPPQCYVFSAEAAAIFIAATTLSDRPILVLTDSHSVIPLTSEAPTHPWVQAMMKSAPPNTVFCWVPGHCGIPGNSEADFLAGAGPSAPRSTEVPLHDVKRWIVSKVREAWDAEWVQNRSLFIRRIKGTTRKLKEQLNQRDQKLASRLRTGHT
ncbi:uncharacterized protein LOC135712896 [Ochlerotatus camptorhynchus]|uniref:uncharacterized protein LOC135712896 n=1 Tax=Ochlerotatus camptorhynchus TaxID=644619 RepID=UPI0031D9707C